MDATVNAPARRRTDPDMMSLAAAERAARGISPDWRLTALLVLAFVLLTAADIETTLMALDSGNAVELNPNAAKAGGGIRIFFLILANAALLLPLSIAFHFGVARARRVPGAVLTRWWRHVLDSFYLNPLSEAARVRAPLRLVTAAMTLLALKSVILFSNILVVMGYQNPTSLLAGLWTQVGLSGAARYWAAYALMVVPCYVVGVGLAASTLRLARAHAPAGLALA